MEIKKYSSIDIFRELYLGEMGGEAEIWPSLYCQPDALGPWLFTELHGVLDIHRGVAWKGVMQIANEVIPVIQWKRHEGTAHENILNLHYSESRSDLHQA